MGDFGRITSLTDLSSRIDRRQQIQAAAALLRAGAPRALKPNRTPRPPLAMPDDFAAALAQVKAAQQTYDAFPPGQQRDYLAWVLEARREDTRAKRIAQAAGWSSAAWTGDVGIRRRRLPGRGQARRGHGADLVRRHAAEQAPGTGADEEVGTAAGGGRTAEGRHASQGRASLTCGEEPVWPSQGPLQGHGEEPRAAVQPVRAGQSRDRQAIVVGPAAANGIESTDAAADRHRLQLASLRPMPWPVAHRSTGLLISVSIALARPLLPDPVAYRDASETPDLFMPTTQAHVELHMCRRGQFVSQAILPPADRFSRCSAVY